MSEPAFAVGDRVFKHSGDYQLAGYIRAAFTTRAGKSRYVVEHDNGILHIYSAANLRPWRPWWRKAIERAEDVLWFRFENR